jgi:hypothetical protein
VILPAILLPAIRGAMFLSRTLVMGSRLAVRGLGSAARWVGGGVRKLVSSTLKAAGRAGKSVGRSLANSIKKQLQTSKPRLPKSRTKVPKLPPEQAKALKEFEKFFKEVPARSTAIQHYILKNVTKQFQVDTKSAIKKKREIASSIQSGVLVDRNPVYAVYIKPKAKKLSKTTAKNSLIYVKPRKDRVLAVTPRKIKVLETYGPWTAGSLPFIPDPKLATLIRRQAKPKVIREVQKARAKDAPKWKAELRKAGMRDADLPKQIDMKDIEVTTDVGQLSVNFEFGIGGDSIPHWRPAIQKSKLAFSSTALKDEAVKRAATDPKFKDWKRWKPISEKVTVKQVRELERFQKKMGFA